MNSWAGDEPDEEAEVGAGVVPAPTSAGDPRRKTATDKRVQDMREAVLSSPVLAQMRLLLAEGRIDKPPPEYVSFCQHLAEEQGDFRRLQVAEVVDVCRARKVPDSFKEPVVVEARSTWRPRRWTMAFWSYECGEQVCRCFRRYPPFATDAPDAPDAAGTDGGSAQSVSGARAFDMRVDEFAKYVGVLRDMEPTCSQENYLVFPRFFVGGWCPFGVAGSEARSLWEEDLRSGRKLWAPPGLQDLTDRWVKMFCAAMNVDWKETLASMDRMQLGPAGSVSRLHVENASAHTWHGQIQGRRAFVLFSPKDGPNLYPGGACEESQDRGQLEERVRRSAVDVLRPSKGLPKFRDCRALLAILEPGEILVVPHGWWLYSVTLEPSATLTRRFWNMANKDGICEELEAMYRENFESQEGAEEGRARLRTYIEKLRYKQQQDYSSDED